jgi:hypothetical protein
MKSTEISTIVVLALVLMVCFVRVGQAAPMGTAWTYQGWLMDKNRPADGLYDFQFRLYDSNDPCTGTQLASPIDINNLDVIDGHFVVELDFGSGIFDGNAVWLETRVVRSPMGSDPATLSPLLELTPTPYALYAQTAPAGHSLDAADGAPTDSVYVDGNGNVGIGTTSPGVKLDVAGYINAADYYLLNNSVLVYSPAASGAFFYGWDASVKRHSMSTDGVQRFVIDDSGNVGVGTTSPSTKLDVAGTVNATAFVGDGSGLTGIAGDLDWIISGNDMYSAPSGNIGIGTTNPQSKLSVGGDGIANIGVYGVGSYAGVYGRDSDTGAYGYFGFNTVGVYGGGSDFGIYGGGNDYGVYGYGPGTGVHGLDTISGSYGHIGYDTWGGYFSGDGYFSGNVGIGTESPSAKLDVNGDMNISSAYKIGGDNVLSTLGTYNTFLGIGAGYSNTAGRENTFLGYGAGYSNTGDPLEPLLGSFNTFVGFQAGYSNTTGLANTFLGYHAGRGNTTGLDNTFVGEDAGYNNTEGNKNTFLGFWAGQANRTGNNNTYLGYWAGRRNTGTGNVFIGYMSGYNVVDSNDKLYIANGPDDSNTLIYGDFSTGNVGIGTTNPSYRLHVAGGNIGLDAGRHLFFGPKHIIEGGGALEVTSTAGVNVRTNGVLRMTIPATTGNVGIGANPPNAKLHILQPSEADAFRVDDDWNDTTPFVIDPTGNVGIGTGSPSVKLDVNGDININSAYKIGGDTILSTLGTYNTFLGIGAGYSNTAGGNNTFIGSDAGHDNTEGRDNTFLGMNTGYRNVKGHYNTFLGYGAGHDNTEGSYNIILGLNAGWSNTTGSNNTILGSYAGWSNTTGTGNIFIGYHAGYNANSSDKLYIANGPDDSNTLIYGDFSTGQVGIGTTNPSAFRLYVNGTAYSTGGWLGSDRRFKENIETIESPLDKIQSIKGVSFEWKTSEYKEKGFPDGRHFGVIAQEVEKVLPEIVKEGPDGDKAVSYTELVPILTEAVKQQQKQIEDLQQEIARLKHFMKKVVEYK